MATKRKSPEAAASAAASATDAKRQKNEVVGLSDWITARKQLLEAEKKFSKARRALAKQRQELPWTIVQDYTILSADGVKTTLSSLINPGGNLIVYHFMFGAGSKMGCSLCSFFCDGFDGALPHILPSTYGIPRLIYSLANTHGYCFVVSQERT